MRVSSVGSLSLLALASCGGTVVEPTDVRSRIVTDLGNVLRETKAAYDSNAGTLPGAVLRTYLPSFPAMPAIDGDPDAAITWLTDQLFTDAHYLGDGIYRVPAELVCSSKPDCVTTWDAAQVRLRVEDDDGLRFWVQIGADHDEPIEFTLRHTGVAVTADLDAANYAMIALAPAFGVSAANLSLSGGITADVTVLGAAHARATLSFDRPLDLAVQGSGFTSAAATVATVELGDAFKASLALGETRVHDADTNQDLDLPGATFDAAIDASGLELTNVSLGHRTTTLSIAGVVGKTIDLNPTTGRSFSLSIAGDQRDEAETVEQIQGHADIVMTTNHTVLGDEAPQYDVAELNLDGWISLTASELAVVDGSFSLITNPAQYSFAATKNQCVTMGAAHVVATCN